VAELRFEHRMTDADALMWTIEKDPMLRSTITAVLLLDRAPDAKRLRHLLDRGTRLVPRMRQRVRGNPMSVAPPRWEVDPHFDLDYHLRWVRAGGDRDLRAVLDLAEPMAMQGFDRARPLWEMVVVEDLADGGAALVMKVHHAITDGVGAVRIALVMFELERDAPLSELPEEPEVAVMNQLQRFVDAFEHERRRNLGIAKRLPDVAAGAVTGAISDPVGSVRRFGETAASVVRLAAPANVPLSPIMAKRSLSVHFDTISLPLPAAKAAARAAGGRLNDAFLAASAAGLRRYHEALGAPTEALRISMPINLRGADEGDATGNNFAPARFVLPIAETDPVAAMAQMRALVAEQRAEPALAMVDPLARVLNRLPTSVATGLFGAMLKGVDLVASNVPGAPIELFTAGSRVQQMFALGPMAGSAVNLTLLSYLDEVHIGINLDPAAVTEPERFVDCYRAGWDDVLAAATA
jgi:WS/DGAT/MGAT family acyltransferase